MGHETKDNINRAMKQITRCMGEQQDQGNAISFQEFLDILATTPYPVMRNAFQVFHDMIKHYLGEGIDEYPDDPESIGFVYYDCNRLFIEGSDHPFFADRPFANRLVNLVEALRRGAQQNKIYIFEGPHGCGKSTFLNNLVMKFEEYANTKEGQRFETVWRLNFKTLGSHQDAAIIGVFERLLEMEEDQAHGCDGPAVIHNPMSVNDDFVEVPCPSHDNPIMLIPKQYRREFFDDLLENDEFKWRLFTEKEYEWVFRDNPCTICSSIYSAILSRVKNPMEVFDMVYARPYKYNRRLGEGISVFNSRGQAIKGNCPHQSDAPGPDKQAIQGQ